MEIAVIDYESGNLHSVVKVFEKVALAQNPHAKVILTNKAADILNASHIILPGQGAFDDCANALRANQEVWQALHDSVLHQGKAFFGICVGMQLLADKGLEGQGADGLGWIGGIVNKITPTNPNLKIPHMGWNTLHVLGNDSILENVDNEDVYFAHSWAIQNAPAQNIYATTDYGGEITVAVGKDNIIGTQFHPEKSQKVGQKIIANFLQWKV